MIKLKVLAIVVDEIPKSCADCCVIFCRLPVGKRGDVLSKYSSKRHKDCLLRLNFIKEVS